LTRKLITFSKGGSPQKRTASVARLIRQVVDFTLSGSSTECDFVIQDRLWAADLDEAQVGQALHNIVVNALEAMPRGGRLAVAARNETLAAPTPVLKPGRYVTVIIRDSGCGISDNHLQKIFLPYFSTKQMGNRKGTGLGLSISYSIIRSHGGHIAVDSHVGVGTAVKLFLPASNAAAGDIHVRKKAGKRSVKTMDKRKILVMDDEQMIREIAGEMLNHLGYAVEMSPDGIDAVDRYRHSLESGRPFDAVLLDLTVRGGMGGEEALRKIMAIDPQVKGIVSSGYSDNPIVTDYKRFGFTGAIAKPYNIKELGEELERVIFN
jgi:CheY-like chemotaxis protein